MSTHLSGSLPTNQPTSLPCHDELFQLARNDPQAFERLTRTMIDSQIELAPERVRPRLRGLQFHIDGIRCVSRSAMGAAVKIYQMMWDSFLQLNDNLQAVVNPAEAPGGAHKARQIAQVIAFQRQAGDDPVAAAPPNPTHPMLAPDAPHQIRR